MIPPSRQSIFLSLYMDLHLLPVATTFVEKGAVAMGLGHGEAVSLSLATEEIFSCICRQGPADHEVGLTLVNGGYFVRVDFDLPGPVPDIRAFNLTACVLPDDDANLQNLGLLIASRSADRFTVSEEGPNAFRLSLVKEKVYPRAGADLQPLPAPVGPCAIRAPGAEELKLLVRAVRQAYPAHAVPAEFDFPGKVVDMVACGQYQAAAAIDSGGRIGGGVFWRRLGPKTVECCGPYTLGPEPDDRMAVDLLENCINAIARLPQVLGLVSRLSPRTLPPAHFEYLGSLAAHGEAGEVTQRPAYFRQMHEDSGTVSWSHPGLEPFLKQQYRRLVLPREIRIVEHAGEGKSRFSVLSAEVDRLRREAILRPVLPGIDQEDNLRNHLDLLRREGLLSLFVILDLAYSHQAEFMPALSAVGFQPSLVVPYGGDGDLLVFQPGDGRP